MPRYSSPVFAPGFVGAFESTGFGVTFYVSNTTNPAENQGAPGPDTRRGRSPLTPFTTVAAAVSEAVSGRGDVIVLQRGTYSVADLTIDKAGLTFLGAVRAGYPDHVLFSGDVYVNASGVSFYNIEFFSNHANETGVSVGITSAGVFTTESDSVWFENCSFASDGTTEPEYGARLFGGNNITFRNCRLVDQTRAISFRGGLLSAAPSHVTVEGCEFLENTTADLTDAASVVGTGDNLGALGGVRNFVCVYNVFGSGPDAAPTDFVNIGAGAGTGTTGIMGANSFAHATNEAAVITIPAGIFYPANYTGAGVSAARPA